MRGWRAVNGLFLVTTVLESLAMVLVPSLWVVAVSHWSRAFAFAAASTLLCAHLVRVLPPADQTLVMALTPTPRNLAAFAIPLVAAAAAPIAVGAVLAVGAVAHAGASATGWLAERATKTDRPERPLSAEA